MTTRPSSLSLRSASPGGAPGYDLGHLGLGDEPQHGDMLAAAAGDLSGPPPVHAGAAKLPVVAGAQPAGHLLEVGKRPLEVSPCKDDAALGAHVDHLVGVGEAGLDRLVGGDPLDPRLGAGDHRILYVFAGQHDCGDVGHDLPVHCLGVRVEGLDAEAFPDRPEPLRVAFGNCDKLGIG